MKSNLMFVIINNSNYVWQLTAWIMTSHKEKKKLKSRLIWQIQQGSWIKQSLNAHNHTVSLLSLQSRTANLRNTN